MNTTTQSSSIQPLVQELKKTEDGLPKTSLHVHRSLAQLAEATKRLVNKKKKEGIDKTKGQRFLSKRIDPDKLSRDLPQNLKSKPLAEEERPEADLGTFLARQNDLIILSVIEEAKKETELRFKKNFVNTLEQDWEESRKKAVDGYGYPHLFPAAKKEFDPLRVEKYADVVASGCQLDKFISLSQQFEPKNTHLANSWLILKELLEAEENRKSKERRRAEGAKKFLENQFKDFIETHLKQNYLVADLGGDPRFLKRVEAFIRETKIRGTETWMQLYFLLRAGERRSAEELAHQKFHCSLKDAVKPSKDEFQSAVYWIVHKDTSNPTKFSRTWEDFLWFKFSALCRDDTSDEYVVNEMKRIKQLFKEEQYTKGRNPLAFFQILLLTQQYSEAIEYLYYRTSYHVEAVHFAIILAQKQLLDSGDFRKLIENYAPQTSNPYNYYFLIKNEEEKLQCIKEHIRITKDFDAIKRYLSNSDPQLRSLFQKVTLSLAESSSDRGRHEEAIHLYWLISSCEKIMETINRQLGLVVSLSPRAPERIKWLEYAQRLDEKLGGENLRGVNMQSYPTFVRLKTLARFFDSYYEFINHQTTSDTSQALGLIKEINLLPQTDKEIQGKLREYQALDGSPLKQNIPRLLLATMEILVSKSRQNKTSELEFGRALVNFASRAAIDKDVLQKLNVGYQELEKPAARFYY